MKFEKETNAFYDSNILAIEVDYYKGGFNPFTGKQEGRGVYVHVRPEKVENNCRSFNPFGEFTFKILVKNLNRKSQKQIDMVGEKIAPHIDGLVAIAETKDKRAFYDKVMSIVLN